MFHITAAEFVTILAMMAATYSTRVLGWLFLKDRQLSPRMRKLLDAAPGCVMVAVVAPSFMTTVPADLIALAAAILISTRGSLALTVVGGVAVDALLRHIAPFAVPLSTLL
jgi:uncharacterized membrane protein